MCDATRSTSSDEIATSLFLFSFADRHHRHHYHTSTHTIKRNQMLFIDTLKETAVVGRLIILADTIDVSLDIVQSVIWLNNGNVHAVVLMLSSIIAYVTSRGFDYHLAQHYDLTNNENWSNEQYGHPMTAADIATSWRVQMKEARRSFYLHGWIFEASALSLAFYFSADAATSFSDQPVLAKINVVSTFVQLAIVVLNWLRVYGRNCEAKEQGSDAEYSYCYYFLFVVFSVALTVGFFVHQSVNPNVDPTFGVVHTDDFQTALWIIWGINCYAVFWYSKHIFFWDGGVHDSRNADTTFEDCFFCYGCCPQVYAERVEHRVCSCHSVFGIVAVPDSHSTVDGRVTGATLRMLRRYD